VLLRFEMRGASITRPLARFARRNCEEESLAAMAATEATTDQEWRAAAGKTV